MGWASWVSDSDSLDGTRSNRSMDSSSNLNYLLARDRAIHQVDSFNRLIITYTHTCEVRGVSWNPEAPSQRKGGETPQHISPRSLYSQAPFRPPAFHHTQRWAILNQRSQFALLSPARLGWRFCVVAVSCRAAELPLETNRLTLNTRTARICGKRARILVIASRSKTLRAEGTDRRARNRGIIRTRCGVRHQNAMGHQTARNSGSAWKLSTTNLSIVIVTALLLLGRAESHATEKPRHRIIPRAPAGLEDCTDQKWSASFTGLAPGSRPNYLPSCATLDADEAQTQLENRQKARQTGQPFRFTFTCRDTTPATCEKARAGFEEAGRRVALVLNITETVLVNATFRSFCDSGAESGVSCERLNGTLGMASPSAMLVLTFRDGVQWTIPQVSDEPLLDFGTRTNLPVSTRSCPHLYLCSLTPLSLTRSTSLAPRFLSLRSF